MLPEFPEDDRIIGRNMWSFMYII